MLTRERLWQRVCGAELWPLPWAMAAACAVPWLVPERWEGHVPLAWLACGWVLVGLSLGLLRWRALRVIPLACLLVWITFLGLRRQALWEASVPAGFQELEGTVSEPWRMQGNRRVSALTVRSPDSLAGCELPLGLPLEGDPAPEPGAPVRFRAELQPIEPGPVFIAERPLWRARSDRSPRRVFVRSAQLLEPLGPPRPSPLLRLRLFFLRRFEALDVPGGMARDLWGALTLGLPPARDEVFSVFAESGTIHTLIVSGLQVTLVMGVAEAFWRRLLRRGSGATSVLSGLLYAAIVGFSAPVWRGLLMGAAWVLGRSRGWRLPPVLTLHGALLLWLITHPAAGCEPGFLLAWWALLGLLWGVEPLAGLMSPLLGRWARPAAGFLAPWLATIPLLALFHGGIPIWGIFANLLILPLVSFLTPLCLVLILLPLPWIVPGIGGILAWTGERLVPVFARVVPLGTQLLWPWILLALGWIGLGQAGAALRRTRALVVLLVGVSGGLLLSRGTGRAPRSLSLEAVDVGQGDALLLRVPGGHATLIDTGLSPWSARRIARVLSRRGVREPLDLVVTHPHQDHAGGWPTLVRLRSFERVHVPGLTGTWAPAVPEALVRDSREMCGGEAWRTGEAELAVRWPPKPLLFEDANTVSLVLRVRWRDRELWLMGDALALQERDLLDLGDPGSGPPHRLLKAGHHGSRSASDSAWVEALRPEVALITAGRRNAFGFPHAATLDVLRAAGCGQVWVTGHARGVRLEAVPGGWKTETGSD